jgi:hypothetical protein
MVGGMPNVPAFLAMGCPRIAIGGMFMDDDAAKGNKWTFVVVEGAVKMFGC